MKEQHDWINRGDLSLFNKLHQEGKNNWYVNKFHLTSYSGAMGNPCGLVFYKGWYYIFFQNCPFSEERIIPSWGLYLTTDFIHYDYHGIAITPSTKYDKDGAYSGNAHVEAGQLYFYYTGAVQIHEGLETSFTLKSQINLKKRTATKKMLFGQDLSTYSGHFLNPMVFDKNGGSYMINGAQTKNKKGTLSLFGAQDYKKTVWHPINNLDWNHLKQLAPSLIETPSYHVDQGEEYLYFSATSHARGLEGRRTWYQNGEFNQGMEFTSKGQLLPCDYGLDFYAPQFFQNISSQNILIGWLGNPASKPSKTLPPTWLNQLTIPREVHWKHQVMYQTPIRQLKKLRSKILPWSSKINYHNGVVELMIPKIKEQKFHLDIVNDKKEQLGINYEDGVLQINRSKMSLKDNYNLPPLQKIEIGKISNLHILIDRSCIEIFINDGRYTVSSLFFVENHNLIKTDLIDGEVHQLKGFSYDEQNTIFLNFLSH